MTPSQKNAVKPLFAAGKMSRLVAVLAREGILTPVRRKMSRAAGRIVERWRIRRLARRRWKADGRAVFLLLSHRSGGGTERHVRELVAALRGEGVRPVLVRPSLRGRVVWEESDDSGRVVWCRESASDPGSAEQVLDLLAPVHAHVHHLIGLPEAILNFLIERGVPYDWTIHDYYTICPRVNLIGERGTYCGEPDEAGCNRCLARVGDDQGRPVPESIAAWRKRWGRLLVGARRVFVPSLDVFRRMEKYFPGLSLRLRPHPESLPSYEGSAASLFDGESVRVVLLGTITQVKGSDRLLACAGDARQRRLPLEFYVIGATDRDRALARVGNVHLTGRYREHELHLRLAATRPHVAFLPSVCPESFMYTLSRAMAARLFVVCFDLGAQAERVRACGWGQVLADDLEPSAINDQLLAAARRAAKAGDAPPAPQPASYTSVLECYYEFTAGELDRFGKAVTWDGQRPDHHLHGVRRKDNAHIH